MAMTQFDNAKLHISILRNTKNFGLDKTEKMKLGRRQKAFEFISFLFVQGEGQFVPTLWPVRSDLQS